jgi:hypothetical protein
MALKRYIEDIQGDMSHYMITEGERGGIVTLAATGAFSPEMDAGLNVVAYAASHSGKQPIGMLMHTVEDYDTTKIAFNYQNMDIVPINSKVYVMKKGVAITNMIDPARLASVDPGKAYVTRSGLLSDLSTANNIEVGNFESYPSSDGFVKVSINIG